MCALRCSEGNSEFDSELLWFACNVVDGAWSPPLNTGCMLQKAPGEQFTGQLRVSTWNSQSLFGVNIHRAGCKQTFLYHHCALKDVIGIQETHSHHDLVHTFEAKLRLSHQCFWSHHPSHSSGGVLLIIALPFLKLFDFTYEETLEAGRCHIVFCNGQYGNIALVVLHIEPLWSCAYKSAFLRRLHTIIRSHPQYVFVMFGDFNFVALGEATHDITNKTSRN